MNEKVQHSLSDAFFLFCEGAPTVEKCDPFLAMVTKTVATWKAQAMARPPSTERPCCMFLNVDNVTYKGIYLPGVEEFAAHGYKRELYDRFMESWKRNIDEHGRP